MIVHACLLMARGQWHFMAVTFQLSQVGYQLPHDKRLVNVKGKASHAPINVGNPLFPCTGECTDFSQEKCTDFSI